MSHPGISLVRRCVSTAALAAFPLFLLKLFDGSTTPGGVMALMPLASAMLLMHVPRMAAQIAWRAILWFHALAFTFSLAATPDAHDEGALIVVTTVAFFVPLLVMGWHGLGPSTGAFRPHAFRTTMILSIVLALADAAVFLVPGTFMAWDVLMGRLVTDAWLVPLMLLSGVVLVAGAVGMYRLKTAGVFLALLGNAVMVTWVAVVHVAGQGSPAFIWVALGLNVGVQLVLQGPLLAAMVRGPSHAAGVEKIARYVPGVVLCAMATFCIASHWAETHAWLTSLQAS